MRAVLVLSTLQTALFTESTSLCIARFLARLASLLP